MINIGVIDVNHHIKICIYIGTYSTLDGVSYMHMHILIFLPPIHNDMQI